MWYDSGPCSDVTTSYISTNLEDLSGREGSRCDDTTSSIEVVASSIEVVVSSIEVVVSSTEGSEIGSEVVEAYHLVDPRLDHTSPTPQRR